MLEAMQQSFFQHALIAGTLVAIMCSFLGVYVVLKRIVFLSIALAQIASAGVALGLLLHLHPLVTALAGSLGGAAWLSRAGQRRRVPVEAILGISYVVAAALGFIFLAKNPLGEARALKMLFGNILSVPIDELIALGVVVPLLGLVHFLFSKEFLFVSFDSETARAQGVNARFWDLLLYLMVALAVALAIKTTGVLLTFALLVVPATTARLLANRIGPMFGLAVAFGVLSVPAGLLLALRFDLPTGSTIAATSAGLFLIVAVARQVASVTPARAASAMLLAVTLLLGFSVPAAAQGRPAEALAGDIEQLKQAVLQLEATVRSQQELIRQQQQRIDALNGAPQRRGAPEAQSSSDSRALPLIPLVQTQPARILQAAALATPPERPRIPPYLALLPEVRIEGNFIYNATFDDRRQLDAQLGEELEGEEFFVRRNRFNFREVELGLRSAVDPFATFEAIISAEQAFEGELEVGLEEGILTLPRLPLRIEGKLGKFRTGFGEFNESDPEEFPEVDRPNVITNVFGKEGDGWIDTGAALNVPFAVGDVPFLLSGGVFNGDNEEAFHGGEAGLTRKPAYYGRLEGFWELGAATGLEAGAGFASGHTLDEADRPNLRSRIFNTHLELDYRHPVLGLYRGFNFLTEFFYTWRDHAIEAEDDDIIGRETVDRFGLYALGELQLARNWFVAGRLDYSQLPERGETGPAMQAETAGSAILSYNPSRFLTLRGQYKHTERNFALDSDEIFLQALFLVGFERPGPF